MRVLFSKINDQRLPEFQIKTSIVKMPGGEKRVRKEALGEEAMQHIENMLESYCLLTQSKKLDYVRPVKIERGVEFDYIEGPTLAQNILQAAEWDDKKNYQKWLEQYFQILKCNDRNICEFETSRDFEKIFGARPELKGQRSVHVADIDVNPDNIVCTENGFILLDYEWTFDFVIPLDYIIYRNLLEFYLKNNYYLKKLDSFDSLIDKAGISARIRTLDEMDRCFREWVHGKPDQNIWKRYEQKQYHADIQNNGLIVGYAANEMERLNARIEELGEWGRGLDLEIEDLQSGKENYEQYEKELKKTGKELKSAKKKLKLAEQKYDNMCIQKQQNYEWCMYYKNMAEALQNSRSYRLSQKISKIFAPVGSRRRELVKKIYGKMRPVKESIPVEKIGLPHRRSFGPITIPTFDAISVSIVIPVYNQFEYTYNCIDSIIKNTESVKYEIILADDVSSDRTKKVGKYVTNLRVIRNETNQGFLLNCNHAAQAAWGDYILFLNNDTQVRENWLAPLVKLMEKKQTVGVVGSKLIGADGKLQEAGGIIWRDATGWNYGLGNDPALPEYNYVKEVDYVSGASLMIRKSLWDEIGGFDTLFAPAYFEDTDLAFEARKRGYKVMYQPLSEVIHFEGVSNGTSEESGIKSYQKINREKFREKWSEELKNHFDNACGIPVARERSWDKKMILVVDHYVPTFDKDAGSRAVFNYLRLLLDMGYNVKFLGDNFYNEEPYTTTLEQMGIEVLFGETYAHDRWKNWVIDNKEYLHAAILNRPHIACNYIDFLKAETNAKILYYGHDLHFLREMREYEVTGNEDFKFSAEEWKAREYDLMSKADYVVMLSEEERKIIKQEFDIDIITMPIFSYREFPESEMNFKQKKNLLFVGGFAHRPNEDGLKWFVENVWPEVQKNLPGVELNVIGSHPTDAVKSMANDKIFVRGFVSDEKLASYYANSRVCVIPLRYGAGIKGKTIEAMYHRISIVSTGIGIEGLPGIEKIIDPVSTPEEFAKQIIEKYNNEELLRQDSNQYLEYLKQNFSSEKMKKLFTKMLV